MLADHSRGPGPNHHPTQPFHKNFASTHLMNNIDKMLRVSARGGRTGQVWDAHPQPASSPEAELRPGLPTMPLVGADGAGCGQPVHFSFPRGQIVNLSRFRNQKANPAYDQGVGSGQTEPG